MKSINGLPAHVLFVHAPVVLVPLAALLSLAASARPGFRHRTWWLVPTAVAAGLIATQLAVMSGYRFDEVAGDVVDTTDHQALGEATRNLVVVFLLGAAATVWLDRQGRDPSRAGTPWTWTGQVGSIVTTLVGVMATVWMIRTGEEGARLVWDGVLIVTSR